MSKAKKRTNLFNIVMRCSLLNMCLSVTHITMCFGSFHLPLVAALQMSWPMDNRSLRVFSDVGDGFPNNTNERNFSRDAGNTSSIFSRSWAVGGHFSSSDVSNVDKIS